MNFNQHINSIQTLVSTFNLSVIERHNHGLVHDVRGTINGRQIYICVRYASNTIYWRDRVSGESKTFTF